MFATDAGNAHTCGFAHQLLDFLISVIINFYSIFFFGFAEVLRQRGCVNRGFQKNLNPSNEKK